MSRLFELASDAENRSSWRLTRRFEELNKTFPFFRKRFVDAGFGGRELYSCMLSKDFCKEPQSLAHGNKTREIDGWKLDQFLRSRLWRDFQFFEFIDELCRRDVEVQEVKREDLIPRSGSKNYKYAKRLAQFATTHSDFWQLFHQKLVRHLNDIIRRALDKHQNVKFLPELLYEQGGRDVSILRTEIEFFFREYEALLSKGLGTVEGLRRLRLNCTQRLDTMTPIDQREYFTLSSSNDTREAEIVVPLWAIVFCHSMGMDESESLFRSCMPLFLTSLMFCIYSSVVPVKIGHLALTEELIHCE